MELIIRIGPLVLIRGAKIVNDHYQFIYFGRLGISKGLEILLKATSMLQAEQSKI